MAKKKATMTLKDFHGGSIPSDLPLPSAPGMIVRQSDRVGLDRPNAWGKVMGRGDYRLRPGSAGSVRGFNDKGSFLSGGSHIGRNFDEDERTPLDGVSGPRRTVSDESIRGGLVGGVDSGLEFVRESRPITNPGLSGCWAEEEVSRVGGNPWTVRREVVGKDLGVGSWSAMDVATKLAHASALEKVSSGRWQSKLLSEGNRVDIEVIKHPETQTETQYKGYGMLDGHVFDNVDVLGGRNSHEAVLVRQIEKSLIVDDWINAGGRTLPVYERAVSPIYTDVQENRIYDEGHQPSWVVGNFVRAELQQTVHPEFLSERPKMNLLPNSRPSETVEAPPTNYKQSSQKPRDPGAQSHVNEAYERVNTLKSDPDSVRGVQDRPKLNLKPRMQPLDQFERNIETKRNTLFGGARPRELVLKERGIYDVDSNNYDQVPPLNSGKRDVPRGEILPVRYNGKAENTPLDYKNGKNIDRRVLRGDVEKSDMQRKNWRSENQRSSRDLEKNKPPQERAPSPETWRKPVEQPSSPTGLRYGKAASAVELAQAFSRSVSDPKTADRLSGQRGIPGRGQIPFSRLTGPQSRPQINGY
ncbi:hypothetical protein DCAR_0209158 [Daucus carota subsp. sativus]|uniref:Uncharacterized protein n=1 Tax=Daucus carota subsp. sativus TaxID=79200 RepID=A0A166F2S8_DAUCS|nr:PREDICTED: uncharacterized protein LOC108205788 [Daucus carota subsp. sativus]WOG89918.1 hypothetical protein DCAR_0209158 [Daucus carota subsp. sativus]